MEREPEWDESTRGRALRLLEWEEDRCTCGCGQPMSDAHDKTKVWVVDKFVCYAGRAKDRVQREQQKEHEGSPDGWDDGLHYFLREPTQEELDRQPRVTGRAGATDGL